jgi:hypothetical protein
VSQRRFAFADGLEAKVLSVGSKLYVSSADVYPELQMNALRDISSSPGSAESVEQILLVSTLLTLQRK